MSIEALGGEPSSAFAAGDSEVNSFFDVAPTWPNYIADTLKWAGSEFMRPFWRAEAEFQNCISPYQDGEQQKVQDYAKRFFVALFAVPCMAMTLPLALSTFALTGIARLFQSHDFRFIQGGLASSKTPDQTKVFHLNTCMFYGGLPHLFGGMRPAHERFDELAKVILAEDPDILFLCEFNRTLSNPMVDKLSDRYSYFFVDIGLNPLGMENCLFVASRVPILSAHYIPFEKPGEGDQRYINRGFFAIEAEDRWYIYTHLHPRDGEADREMRQQQLDKIQEFIDQKTGGKPCVLLGDLNINRVEEPNTDYLSMIARGYSDPSTDATREVYIGHEGKKEVNEVIDYILVNGKGNKIPLQVNTLDTSRDSNGLPLSDHSALMGTFL